jgi:DNA-binding response OmpR family regulator
MGRNTTTISMRKAVLVVGDDPDLVQLISTMLKGYEFDLLWAPTIQRARDIIAARRIAVLIAEQQVSGESGFDLVREMRKAARTEHTPVLLLTTEVTGPIVLEVKQLRIADLLIKPFDAKRLRKGLAKAVSTAVVETERGGDTTQRQRAVGDPFPKSLSTTSSPTRVFRPE